MLIENGAFVAEQYCYGFRNGSFIIYFLFNLIQFVAIYFGLKTIRRVDSENVSQGSRTSQLLFLFFTFSMAIITIIVLKTSNPGTRFRFYSHTGYERFLQFLDVFYYASFIWIAFRSPDKVYLNTVLYIFVSAVMRFSYTFITPVVTMVMSLFYFHKKVKSLYLLLFILAVFISVVYKLYGEFGANLSRLFIRIVEQGHVFWGVVNLMQEDRLNYGFYPFLSSFFSFKMFSVNPEYGIGELMAVLGEHLAYGFYEAGIRYACNLHAMLIYKTGVLVAPFLVMLLSFIYARLTYKLIKYAMSLNILIFVLYFKLYTMYNDFFTMGEYGYFNFKSLLLALFFIVTKNFSMKMSHPRRQFIDARYYSVLRMSCLSPKQPK